MNDTINTQCLCVIDLLDRMKDLILWRNLIPQELTTLDGYEESSGKKLPPDYRHWVATYGSGQIDFTCGTLVIPSPNDIRRYEVGGRLYGKQPKDSHLRICLCYAGTPILTAMDATIVDEAGFCPVIQTGVNNGLVEEVLASSWPMYLVRGIRLQARMSSKIHLANETAPKLAAEIGKMDMYRVDDGLRPASARARAHNQTAMSDEEYEEWTKNNFGDASEVATQDLTGIPEEDREEDDLNTVIGRIDGLLRRGCSAFLDDETFIDNQTTESDLPVLYELLAHSCRDVRTIALRAMRRILKSSALPAALDSFETNDIPLQKAFSEWKSGKMKSVLGTDE